VKVTAVQAANFIQVIAPAAAPDEPDSNWPVLAVLAFAGSLGLGLVLAFLLDYIWRLRAAGAGIAAEPQGSPASRGHRELPSLPRWKLNQ